MFLTLKTDGDLMFVPILLGEGVKAVRQRGNESALTIKGRDNEENRLQIGGREGVLPSPNPFLVA
jgi:hypothetical protein